MDQIWFMHCLTQTLQILKPLKLFFVVQYPMVNVPSRKQALNHKVGPLFSHLAQVSTKVFEPGHNLSLDEHDTSFQGYREDKQQVTLNFEGDGFLIDAVCEDGYTINFYPRNVPLPKNFIDKGYSPTQSRIIFMSDALTDQYYTCGMDNNLILQKFLRAEYTETNSKTIVHGCF